MIQVALSVENPASDDKYDSNDPTKNQEKLAWEYRKILYDAGAAGIQIQVSQDTDFTGFHSDFASFVTNFDTWIDEAVVASASGLPVPQNPTIPAIISLVPALLAGGWAALIPIIVNFAIDLCVRYIEGKLNPDGGGDVAEAIEQHKEMLEAVLRNQADVGLSQALTEVLSNTEGDPLGDILDEVISAIRTILTEHSINLYSDKEDITFRAGFLTNP